MAVTFVIDISHHQSLSLDLAQTRRDGCEACFLKAGEGSTYVDPTFGMNLAEARAAGQLPAAYWYQRSNASAAAHVAKIQAVVPKDVPVILDVESSSGGVPLTRDIIARLNSAGYKTPLLYLPKWYWQGLGSPSLAGLPPLWSSRYPDNVIGLLASEWAQVPSSYWTGYGGLDVGILQFTSSARIAGYAPLDASAYRGTRDQLATLLGGGGSATPSVNPTPRKVTDMERPLPMALGANAVDDKGNPKPDPGFQKLGASGFDGCKVVIYPGRKFVPAPTVEDPEAGSWVDVPVWLEHIFNFASGRRGVGGDPGENRTQAVKVEWPTEYLLPPGTIDVGIAYSTEATTATAATFG